MALNPQFLAMVLMVTSQAATAHEPPSYSDMLTRAETLARDAASGKAAQTLAEVKERWPLLFSPSKFNHELVEAVKKLGDGTWGMRNEAASEKCIRDVEYWLMALRSLTKQSEWAWIMLDAAGKPSTDLKDLNVKWAGSYKECQSVRVTNTSTVSNQTQHLFSGQYANVAISLPNSQGLQLVEGLCVPDSCSSQDIAEILNSTLSFLGVKLPMPANVVYPQKDIPLDSLAIATIVILAVFGLLMAVGTAVDVVRTHLPRWKIDDAQELPSSGLDILSHPDDVVLLGSLPSKLPPPSVFERVLMAFSVYTNGAKLLSTSQPAGSLHCVHGIRFLSMTWVVLGHSYLLPQTIANNLLGFFSEAVTQWTFQGIVNATVSVDSFFVLSGLLVAYLSLKEMKRTGGKINWIKFYLHRFWRLTPPYMLIILVYVGLSKYMGSGPFWVAFTPDRDNCKSVWWTNLLYINNFVHADKLCLGQSWYLANDMQFYILSPLIFVPLYHSALFGGVSALVFLLATTVTPAALTMRYHWTPGSLAQVDAAPVPGTNRSIDYYFKPYNRMGPYIMGMLTGYLLYRTDCKLRIPRLLNLLGWATATGTALAVLYGLYGACPPGPPMALWEAALYMALNRTAWGVAVGWVVFACVTGNGGFVDTILSWKALIPLSRLTYCIYLLHILVFILYFFNRESTFYFTHLNVVMVFLAVLVVCYMVAFVVSLTFEAPMLALEKIILSYTKGGRRD